MPNDLLYLRLCSLVYPDSVGIAHQQPLGSAYGTADYRSGLGQDLRKVLVLVRVSNVVHHCMYDTLYE